jgi:S-DNA-T family DNA segregation ATPase FtsK/SpoIIIE
VDRCEACAFVYDDVAQSEITVVVRRLTGEYVRRLSPDAVSGPDVEHDLRPPTRCPGGRRSSTRATSATCSRRSVSACTSALHEDAPAFAPMGREERVERDRDNEQAPATVAIELSAAAESFAGDLDELDAAGWARTGVYNWPEREERTVTWIARHTVHEMEHHLHDIDDVLAAAS